MNNNPSTHKLYKETPVSDPPKERGWYFIIYDIGVTDILMFDNGKWMAYEDLRKGWVEMNGVATWLAPYTPAEEKVMKDASYYKQLSNIPGKQQDGLSVEWLELWEQVEIWYGDIYKKESGEKLLKRLQRAYNLSFVQSASPTPEAGEIERLREENERLKESLRDIGRFY